jgi:hypothetical protein
MELAAQGRQEPYVLDEVTTEQSPGLKKEAEEPLRADALHPGASARRPTDIHVERASDEEEHRWTPALLPKLIDQGEGQQLLFRVGMPTNTNSGSAPSSTLAVARTMPAKALGSAGSKTGGT